MPNEQERIAKFFEELSGAVIHAITKGTPADRKRLVSALEQMNAGMPSVPAENVNAKEFLISLVGLLVGEPTPPTGLVEPYLGIYTHILETVFAGRAHHDEHGHPGDGHGHEGHGHPHPGHAHSEEDDLKMKEFLTQLAASTVMVGKKGTADDKKGLAEKLMEVRKAMPEEEAGPRALLGAFASILEGRPVSPDTLPSGYAGIYRKVLGEISGSNK